MQIKKVLLMFNIFTSLSYLNLYGQIMKSGQMTKSYLEKIWNCVIEEGVENFEAKLECFISENNLKEYWKKYLPKPNVYLSSSFDSSSNQLKLPKEIYAYTGITENIPGDGTFQITPIVTLNKSLLDYSESENFSNIGIIDDVKLNIEFSQSLQAHWLFDEKISFEKKELILDKQEKNILCDVEVLSCIENVTQNYISYREYYRDLQIYLILLDFLEKKKASLIELNGRQNVSRIEEFSVEDEIKEYTEEINELKIDLGNLAVSISYYCGEKLKDISESISCELPEIAKVFEKNPNLTYLELQKEKLETEFNLTKQQVAPKFSFGATIPIHTGASDSKLSGVSSLYQSDLTFYIGLNFSDYIENGRQNLYEKYKKNIELIERKIAVTLDKIENEYKTYESLLQSYQKEVEDKNRICQNKKETYSAYEKMYVNGDCTMLDFLQSQAAFQIEELELENSKDKIWLYKWLILNRS